MSTTDQTTSDTERDGGAASPGGAVHGGRLVAQTLKARGVEFTQEPVERYGNVDAGFRDPSGNGWKMIEAGAGQRKAS